MEGSNYLLRVLSFICNDSFLQIENLFYDAFIVSL